MELQGRRKALCVRRSNARDAAGGVPSPVSSRTRDSHMSRSSPSTASAPTAAAAAASAWPCAGLRPPFG
eukprot:6175196-Pleurochrysis_carterae.AAC.1